MKRGKNSKVDERVLREVAKRALEQPRLALYSPLAACVLNYWKSVVPRYSISDELAKMVESELRRRWPALTAKAKRVIERSKK
ncbi:MAG: hypothetical protein NXY59_03405 [Aigarchaeota archaeon]|nr:hypothetical protein [Candidatus Pelearchaeum maunauluense]